MVTLAANGIEGFTTRRVAEEAGTSTPAIYELFGDKSGLVREVFFEGFRQLRGQLDRLAPEPDPYRDLEQSVAAFRRFVHDNRVLSDLMFGRAFADFGPGPDELKAGAATREFLIGKIRRCIEAGLIEGDPRDVAHVLLAVAQGLSAQESAGWLGTSQASRNRRWALAFKALMAGLAPGG
jgi:AcrR family transcriptional regulator